MKFPAQMSLVEEKKKRVEQSKKKKVLEQHSTGYSTGRVEAFLMFLHTVWILTFLLQKQIDSFARFHHS